MLDNVALAREGPIATVTPNRPERRNSLSDGMLADLGTMIPRPG
jgi:enoyl-CoA hydratase/carnithine racemase